MSPEQGAESPVTQNYSFTTSDKHNMQPCGNLHSPTSDANKNRIITLSLINDEDFNNYMSSANTYDGEDQNPTEVSRKNPIF